MELVSKIYDKKVRAYNLLFKISLEEYFEVSEKIINNNKFQRRRVKHSSTVYSLLKKDLEIGCIIPPIVLALSKYNEDIDISDKTNDDIVKKMIKDNIEDLIILDGIQRTYTIRDLFNEFKNNEDKDSLNKIKYNSIRIEIYVGINKLGILYRMLTLNTGQTPMSLRHQIEILYSDYLERDIKGIKLLLESNDESPIILGEYKFRDVIDGFCSYIDRSYLTIDRNEILENIKSLEKLSKENQDSDLFKDFLLTYHHIVKSVIDKSNDWEFDEDENTNDLHGQPFGKNAQKIFTKSQVMTGFGSAIGKLIDFKVLDNIDDINKLIGKVDFENSINTLNNLLSKLDKIKMTAKKIGNDQRMFFHFLFRELFNERGDSYLNLNKAIEESYFLYVSKTQ